MIRTGLPSQFFVQRRTETRAPDLWHAFFPDVILAHCGTEDLKTWAVCLKTPWSYTAAGSWSVCFASPHVILPLVWHHPTVSQGRMKRWRNCKGRRFFWSLVLAQVVSSESREWYSSLRFNVGIWWGRLRASREIKSWSIKRKRL